MAGKEKQPAEKPPLGRPPEYSIELFEAICNGLASSDKGLSYWCKNQGVTSKTFYQWLTDNPSLCEIYTRARDMQAEFMADQIVEIADDSSEDTVKIMKGDVEIEVENKEWVNRSKLRVEARKWIAAKLRPKKYGDKVTTEHTGNIGITQITGMEIK